MPPSYSLASSLSYPLTPLPFFWYSIFYPLPPPIPLSSFTSFLGLHLSFLLLYKLISSPSSPFPLFLPSPLTQYISPHSFPLPPFYFSPLPSPYPSPMLLIHLLLPPLLLHPVSPPPFSLSIHPRFHNHFPLPPPPPTSRPTLLHSPPSPHPPLLPPLLPLPILPSLPPHPPPLILVLTHAPILATRTRYPNLFSTT